MTTSCCGTGSGAYLAIGAHGSTPSRMDFIEWRSTRMMKALSDGGSKTIRGTLDHLDTNATEGMLFVQFRTRLWLTSAKMDILLPLMGLAETPTDTFTLGDTLPYSKIILGPKSTKEHVFDNCVVTDWILEGQKGTDPISIDIGWMGTTWTTQTNGTFFNLGSLPTLVAGYVYPFPDGANNATTLSALGQTVYFPQFRLHADYRVVYEFNNSVTATNICPTDHVLTFATSALYSSCDSNEPLFDTPFGGDTSGASLTLNFQRTVSATNYSTQFVIANAKAIARAPNIKKNDFVRLPLNFQGYATSSTPALVVTNKDAEA